jgi:hypothetical protein
MVDHVDDLHDSLERKLTAYGEFLEATLLLQEALEKEEMASVKQLLTRREELIRDIDGLDRRINRHRPEGVPPSPGEWENCPRSSAGC